MTTAKTKRIHSFSRECIVFYINREYEYDKCVDMPHREIEKKKKRKRTRLNAVQMSRVRAPKDEHGSRRII